MHDQSRAWSTTEREVRKKERNGRKKRKREQLTERDRETYQYTIYTQLTPCTCNTASYFSTHSMCMHHNTHSKTFNYRDRIWLEVCMLNFSSFLNFFFGRYWIHFFAESPKVLKESYCMLQTRLCSWTSCNVLVLLQMDLPLLPSVHSKGHYWQCHCW